MNKFPQLIFQSLRYKKCLLILLAVLWPIVTVGAIRAWNSMSNRVEDWLPEAFEETRHLARFFDVFGSDELLMVSWPGCTRDDPRLAELKTRLLTPVTVNGREVIYFGSVITGHEAYSSLTSEPMNLDHDAVVKRLSGWLMSPDGNRTCAVMTVSTDGMHDRHALLQRVWNVITEMGLNKQDVQVAGPTIESIAIDDASRDGILTLNFVSFFVCIGVTFLCLRSLRVAFLLLAVAVFNQYMTMSLVHYSGMIFDSVMLMAANLTFVVTFSMGIYLINYYRAAMRSRDPQEAVRISLQQAFIPALISATTSSVGLVALGVSTLVPISRFGIAGGIAVALTLITILIYIPLFFTIWPIRSWNQSSTKPGEQVTDSQAEGDPDHDSKQSGDWYLALVERYVFPVSTRWYAPMFAVLSLVAIVGLMEIRDIKASVGMRQFLTSQTKVIKDYTTLENEIGPLIPIEILVHAEQDDNPQVMMQRLRTVYQIQDELYRNFNDAAIIGLKNFLPDLPPEQGGVRQKAAAVAFRRELASQRPELSKLGFFAEKDGQEYWRITIRTYAMRDVDYVHFLKNVERTVDLVLNNPDINPNHSLNYLVTGGVPLSAKAQNQLIKDMIDSFMLAFVLIAITLAILFRNVIAGIAAIIPSIMPGIVVFGIMGWSEIPLEIGTALTICSALGISVDATAHFVNWFRLGVRMGKTKERAVLYAYRRCSLGMLQSTLICCFGLLVFSASSFIPMIRFGFCMFSLLGLSYLFTMFLLPAILCSPLGYFFCRQR